jgi:hypothetical protein
VIEKGRKLREVVYKNGIKKKAFLIANTMVLEDPVKADELKCVEYVYNHDHQHQIRKCILTDVEVCPLMYLYFKHILIDGSVYNF